MYVLRFPANQMFEYHMTGKFKALSDTWHHQSFPLTDYELIVMTEGILYMSYGNKKYTVNPGEYLLLAPSDQMRGGWKQSYCSFYWLHFAVDLKGQDSSCEIQAAEPLQKSCHDTVGILKKSGEAMRTVEEDGVFCLPIHGVLAQSSRSIVLMKQLQDLVKSSYPTCSLNAMSTAIVTEIYGQMTFHAVSGKNSGNRKQVYLDIVDYIQQNLSTNIRIADIAAQFGYNPKYLSHMFTEHSGIPLKQFILNQKMDAANMLLTDGDRQISDIASSLGFSDVHNFSKAYKKVTGLTPTEYRNTYAKRLLYHV